MGFYKDAFLGEVEEKKARKERGEYNGIPFCYPNYRDYVSSIDKGVYYGLLSGPGNGKSRWMRHTFVYEPFKFSLETGYKLKILYFALEDSIMQIYKNLAAHYLWERHGIYISQKLLDSKEKPLPDRYMEVLKQDVEFFALLEATVLIFNDDLDPDAITNRCQEVYDEFGPDYHYIAIIDNYANIAEGNYRTKYEAVSTFSRENVRLYLTKKLGFSVLAILQSDLDTEKYAGRNAGSAGNISAVEPTLGSLGDVKIISRDMHVIWSLFNPWKYGLMTYPNSKGWNIENLRNKFRALIMIKNNLEDMAPRLGLYFDGGKEVFWELPSPDQAEALQKIYVQVLEDERKIKESRSQKNLQNN